MPFSVVYRGRVRLADFFLNNFVGYNVHLLIKFCILSVNNVKKGKLRQKLARSTTVLQGGWCFICFEVSQFLLFSGVL